MLRWRGPIDWIIQTLSGRPVQKLDREVLAALRMGVYQLRWLDRIPPHAAINESVELIKKARKRSAAGFANAILRKVTRESVEWPDEATRLSCPQWLLDRWCAQYGWDTAHGIAEAALRRPERFVRIRPGNDIPAGFDPTDVPGAYVENSADRLKSVAQLQVQDISAQTIVPLLELQPGQTFLDLCSAPGNKTAASSGDRGPWNRVRPLVRAAATRASRGYPASRPRRHPAAALCPQVRSHSGGCTVLRDRHTCAQPGDQMEAASRGSNRPPAPPGCHPAQCPCVAISWRTPGLFHLLARELRKMRRFRALPGWATFVSPCSESRAATGATAFSPP